MSARDREPRGDVRPSRLRTALPWVFLLLFALLLRLLGLSWGLPGPERSRFYHPDERNPAFALAGTDPARLDLNPNHAINPALYYYMTGVAIALDGDLPSPCNRSPREIESTPPSIQGAWIYKGRCVSALLGAATPLLAAAMGTVYGAAAALAAGFLLAVNPAHLIQSHYAAVDVPALAFFLGSLVLALRFAGGGRKGELYGSAFLAGLAVATKYLSGFVFFAPLLALLLRRPVKASVLCRVLGLFLAGLVLGFPAILDTQTFFGPDGIRRLFSYYPYPDDVPKPAGRMVMNALGLPLLGLAGLGAVRAIRRRGPADALLLLLLLFYVVFLFSHPSPFHRHYLPLVAIAALLGGSGALLLLRSAGKTGVVLTAILFLFSLGHAIRIVEIFRAPDVREEAGRWIGEHYPEGVSVGVLGPPSGRGYYTADVDPSRADLAVIGYDARRLAAYEPELFLLTDVEREVPLFTTAGEDERSSFLGGITGSGPYREARRFARPFAHGPVPYAVHPLPTDFSYFRPSITLFERPAPSWKEAHRRAAAAVGRGDFERGKALLDSLLEREPHLLPPRLLRAEISLLDRSPPAEAILHLEKALAGPIEERREGPTHEALVLLHARRGEELLADSLFGEGRLAFQAARDHLQWVEEHAAGSKTNLDVRAWKRRLGSAHP